MKVKVVNCSVSTYWYADKVGEVFEVFQDPDHNGEICVYCTDERGFNQDLGNIVMGDWTTVFPLFTDQQREKLSDSPKQIDAHYNFNYSLSPEDIDNGYIKLDPYFVAKQWKLGSKDDTGILFHCFKLIARFGDKNPKEREILALYKQAKRLAELEGVSLD